MTKPILTLLASVALIAAGAGAAWLLRDHWHDGPKPAGDAEYLAFQERLGGAEPALRWELNTLAATTSAPLASADRDRVHALTRECLDARVLLEIGHVREFVAVTARGEVLPYHFLSEGDRDRLRSLVGDEPSAERILAVREALSNLGAEFGVIRQPPDWNVKIEGEKPPMPFLDLMGDASRLRTAAGHPAILGGAKVPAFSAPEVELIAVLDDFFNRPAARAAFPAATFPLLYRNGRLPPVPDLGLYKEAIQNGIRIEKLVLLPGEKTDPDQVEAIDEIFGRLERFFEAVEAVK